MRMLRQHALAVCIKFLGNDTDFLSLDVISIRKGKWVEAAGLRIARVIANAQPSASTKRPYDMDTRRENTKKCCIIAPNSDEHIVGKYRVIQELKGTML